MRTFRLLYARIHIRLHVVIRVCSVRRSVCLESSFWNLSRMVPGVLLISSAASSDLTVISGQLGVTRLLQSLSKVDFSYSHSHVQAYKSSCLMITSVSGFHSRGVICLSGMHSPGVNWRSLNRESTGVLLVPILRNKEFLFGNTFSII